MAYNQFFPQTYQNYSGYGSQFQNQMMQNPQAYQQQPSQPQIQNGGFVSVRNIEEAYNWPVAPGNSITFKDENSPYVYTKTKGFSQLDQPIFEKYRLVKEESTPEATEMPPNAPDYDSEIKRLWEELKAVKRQIEAFSAVGEKRGEEDAE